jgi:hypothetical protein
VKVVCTIQHVICRPPSDIAMQRDDEWYRNARFHLKLFEVPDVLSGALDLFEKKGKTEK